MLIQHWRWSRRVLEDWPESRAKDTRLAAADLDTAIRIGIDIAVDIPAGTAALPARYIWKTKKFGKD